MIKCKGKINKAQMRRRGEKMKILSIGNSFSTDAQRYVHQISVLNGEPIKAVNLYIGGCPLRKHYFNILEDEKAYDFQFNGESTGLHVSIKDALMSDTWDFVTLQQASFYSVDYKYYEPYLATIKEYVAKYAPTAKLVVHQTWAYSEEAVLKSGVAAESSADMLLKIKAAYERMAKETEAVMTIRSGEAIARVIENGIAEPHRDGHHVSVPLGRMMLGLLWFVAFTGKDADTVALPSTDIPLTEEEIIAIRKTVKEVPAIRH